LNPQSTAEENRAANLTGGLGSSEVSSGDAGPLFRAPLTNQGDRECYTSVLPAVNRESNSRQQELSRQIERLLGSRTLQGAESLRKLLQYLWQRCLASRPGPVKEYQIAVEAFGRRPDFDPQTDATVRVQVRRLRSKLAEYYVSEGIHDPVSVEIPKGSYSLSFHSRAIQIGENPQIVLAPGSDNENPKPSPTKRKKTLWTVVAVLAAILAVAFLLNLARTHAAAKTVPNQPDVFHVFWHPFLTGSEEPWVVFSNAAFVGRPETGMRYYRAGARTVGGTIPEHYTGVGEVLGVLELDRLFNRLGRRFHAKRASLFSLDDAQNRDLIFVGIPAENLALLKLPGPQEFVFERVAAGQRKGDLGIANRSPEPGEPAMYLPSSSEEPLSTDYAIIALTSGLDSEHTMLILAGTTTIGTQAAVDYVCQRKSLAELLGRLSPAFPGHLRPFEAVLRVRVEQDVPVSAELVAMHPIS
jgi:hypothetical protein